MKRAWVPWQLWAALGPSCMMATNGRRTQTCSCPVLLSSLRKTDPLHISACLPSTVGNQEHPGQCQPPENLLLTVFISVEQRLWGDLWYSRFWANESWLDTARYFKMVASQRVLPSLPAGVFCCLGDVSVLAFFFIRWRNWWWQWEGWEDERGGTHSWFHAAELRLGYWGKLKILVAWNLDQPQSFSRTRRPIKCGWSNNACLPKLGQKKPCSSRLGLLECYLKNPTYCVRSLATLRPLCWHSCIQELQLTAQLSPDFQPGLPRLPKYEWNCLGPFSPTNSSSKYHRLTSVNADLLKTEMSSS